MKQAGYKAAKNNQPKAPAFCKEYQAAIAGLKPGQGSKELAIEWLDGYNDRINEELAEI